MTTAIPVALTIERKVPLTKPGDIASALTGRPYLTHSELSTFQSCPLKWHFQYVEHAKSERTSAAMLLGTSVHAAIQHHLEAVMAADEAPSLNQLVQIYRDTWEEESAGTPIQFAREDTAETLAETARQMIERFQNSPYASPAGEIIGIEETLRIALARDLPELVGRVDLIEYRNGELIVSDFKTARSMWSSETAEDHSQQLLLYRQAAAPIAEELGATLKLRFIVLTKAKTPKIEERVVSANADRLDRTLQVMRRVFGAMQAGQVYPAPSPMNCSGCGFQERCEAWHRSTTEVPH